MVYITFGGGDDEGESLGEVLLFLRISPVGSLKPLTGEIVGDFELPSLFFGGRP